MIDRVAKVLFLCYGNPGRLDDGLGPAFAQKLEKLGLEGVKVESDYQLSVEDALTVSQHDLVFFVDASVGGAEPFSLSRVVPVFDLSFTTHSVEPENLLGLAETLFGSKAVGYALGIRGYCFNEFGELVSSRAKENLEAAIAYAQEFLQGAVPAIIPDGPRDISQSSPRCS